MFKQGFSRQSVNKKMISQKFEAEHVAHSLNFFAAKKFDIAELNIQEIDPSWIWYHESHPCN